jgi:hypothetical protein
MPAQPRCGNSGRVEEGNEVKIAGLCGQVCVYVCGEEENDDEKMEDFTWSDRALAGSLSVRPWSSVLAFGVGRSGGVQ